jgi:hypothetical protein
MMRFDTDVRSTLLAALIGISLGHLPARGRQDCTGVPVDLHAAPCDSRSCLACHDGAVASDAGMGRSRLNGTGMSDSHPIMISYVQAFDQAPTKLVAPAQLDRSIRLLHGEVHCVSCHTASADGGWQLARPRAHDALCLGCHRQ